VEAVIAKRYDKILDIGCAEGYYAVGFAMRLPGDTYPVRIPEPQTMPKGAEVTAHD